MKRADVSKRGVDGNLIGRDSLQPAKENRHIYTKKKRGSKENKLTAGLRGIKILDRRKSKGRVS